MTAFVAVLLIILVTSRGPRATTGRRVLWLSLTAPMFATTTVGGRVWMPISETQGAFVMTALAAAAIALSPSVRPLSSLRAWRPLAAFGLLAGASALWSVDSHATLLKAAEWCIRLAILVALARRYSHEIDALTGLWGFTSMVVISAAAGLLLLPQSAFQAAGTTLRLWGAIPRVHPNSLAAIAVASTLLSASIIRRSATRWIRRAWFPMAGVSMLVLLLTRSRSSLVVGAAALACVIVVQTKPALRPVAMSAIGLALLAMITFLQDAAFRLFARGQTADQLRTLTGRTDYWSAAWAYARERPLLGHGFYAGHRIGLSVRLPDYLADVSNLDNMWLENFVNLGIVGVTVTFMIVTQGRALSRRWRRESGDHLLTAAFVSLEFFFFCASFYNPSLNTLGPIGMLYAFVLLTPTVGASHAVLNTRSSAVGAETFRALAKTLPNSNARQLAADGNH